MVNQSGVSSPQLRLLKMLQTENDLTVSELSKRILLPISTVSSILKYLEKKRYLIRERLQRDRRIVKVHLVQEGEQIALSVPDLVHERLLLAVKKLSLKKLLYFNRTLQKTVRLMSKPDPKRD